MYKCTVYLLESHWPLWFGTLQQNVVVIWFTTCSFNKQEDERYLHLADLTAVEVNKIPVEVLLGILLKQSTKNICYFCISFLSWWSAGRVFCSVLSTKQHTQQIERSYSFPQQTGCCIETNSINLIKPFLKKMRKEYLLLSDIKEIHLPFFKKWRKETALITTKICTIKRN